MPDSKHACVYPHGFRINRTNMYSYVVCISFKHNVPRNFGVSGSWEFQLACNLQGACKFNALCVQRSAAKAIRCHESWLKTQKNKGCLCIWPRTQLLHGSGLGFGFDCSCILQHALRRVLAPVSSTFITLHQLCSARPHLLYFAHSAVRTVPGCSLFKPKA